LPARTEWGHRGRIAVGACAQAIGIMPQGLQEGKGRTSEEMIAQSQIYSTAGS